MSTQNNESQMTGGPCPICLQRDHRYRGEADVPALGGFTCTRCARPHVDACREGTSEVCATCAPALRSAAQDRLTGAMLDLIDLVPVQEIQHLDSIVEILHQTVAFRVPLSGEPTTLAPAARTLADALAELTRLESPIEHDLHLLLEREGLRADFQANEPLRVEFVRRDGSTSTGETRPDFRHRRLPLVIYCDGNHHGELRIREIDHGVVDALQAQGYLVLRFTGRQIRSERTEVVARIRRAIMTASRSHAA
jgi:very-short-patch-repair endonuclease